MYYQTTLKNPRHEAFALAIAQGFIPISAYGMAGFSKRNGNARSKSLLRNRDIKARIEVLKACLPQLTDLKDRFAPSLALMPETKDEMIAWLWQVMNGTRQILPLQLRAANLFSRLHGWHLAKPSTVPPHGETPGSMPHAPSPMPPMPLATHNLLDHERALLATHNKRTLNADLHQSTIPASVTNSYYSTMADMALYSAITDPTRAQIFEKDRGL